MTFDLYFFRRPGQPELTAREFLAYFEGRWFLKNNNRVDYSNSDTGVNFHFIWNEQAGALPAVPAQGEKYQHRPCIHFCISLIRQHTFALEAERILTPLVKALNLVVLLPRPEGVVWGDYTGDGFLRAWKAGNSAIYRMKFAQQKPQDQTSLLEALSTPNGGLLSLPAAQNRAIWDWNFARDQLHLKLLNSVEKTNVFVPRVSFTKEENSLLTFCVFPDLLPSAIPRVDRVVLVRDGLPAPFPRPSATNPGIVSWEALREVSRAKISPPDSAGGLDYLLFDYGKAENAPPSLVEFVCAAPAIYGLKTGVHQTQILDSELISETMK